MRLAAAFLALVAFSPALFADQIVYFVNGKAIIVKSIEKGPKFTVLEIEGGGRIGLPSEQIVRIEDLQVSAPAMAAPAAPVVAVSAPPVPAAAVAPPATAQSAAAQAPALPPADPTAPGPGIGGRVEIPGQGFAGLRPLPMGDGGAGSPYGAGRLVQPPGPGGRSFNQPLNRNALFGRFGGRPGRPGRPGQRGGDSPQAVPPPGGAANPPQSGADPSGSSPDKGGSGGESTGGGQDPAQQGDTGQAGSDDASGQGTDAAPDNPE